ncbi:ABC transporter ATP-binding protein [Nordella sp. HKS 07]|uniref:ABC transporter ATP-binding protein n=1 Tax=Nordella sp. HKS 07 TaxID=2712222 RepID=UPI0013E1B615|nr:ABC transporter ATP-binding protein [Nordella sp. HKS 07]QIG52203.1 ABC transporter ATP-binding protein [Nordella sp. HKS 07]
MTVSTGFLEIRNLVKRYGSAVAVDGASLSIAKGDFLTLLGPSGSGKTTILMAIAGFVKPTTGEIVLSGRDLVPLEPEERDLGIVFQGYALFPHMTVAQNVAFPLELRKWKPDAIARRVEETLAMVDLARLADRRPAQLSGGQQQRVALARCLSYQPDLLLLDEPLSALDRQLRARLQDELKSLHQKVGVTVVNVTHDQDEALSMSTHIAVINGGRIVQYGTPDDIYENPATRFVARFIGRSNVVAIERLEAKGDTASALIAGKWLPVTGNPAITGKAALSLRPEMIEIGATDKDGATGRHVAMDAHIENCVYHGGTTALDLRTAIGPLRAEMPTSRLGIKPTPGSVVRASWPVHAGRIVSEDDTALDQQ